MKGSGIQPSETGIRKPRFDRMLSCYGKIKDECHIKSDEFCNRYQLWLILHPKYVPDLEFSINKKNTTSCPESALQTLISQSTEEKELNLQELVY